MQINELITGVQLSAELCSSSPELRHFISFCAYTEKGRIDRILNSDKVNTALFWVRDYEVPAYYIENDFDDADSEFVNSFFMNDIRGIENLENELLKRVDDLSIFIPAWKVDAPL